MKNGSKITNYLTKFYGKYASTISLNKYLLLSGLDLEISLNGYLYVLSSEDDGAVLYKILKATNEN